MPREALSEEQLESFRLRAVEAAMRLFAEQGYAAVTMRALAAELGVSAMTPYRYFANKEQLFDMVRADAFRRLADHQQSAAQRPRDPLGRLAALCHSYVQFALSEPNAYRIMFSLHDDAQEASEALQREQARSFSYLLAAVEEAAAQRLVHGDPLTCAHLFWSQAHGLVSLELAGKLHVGRTLAELCDAFVASLVERAQRSRPTRSPSPQKRSRRKV
jgi:AcrR family transcriptional regulator